MASKLKSIQKHFKRRMRERFGITVTKHIIENLIRQIHSGAECLFRQSLTKTCFRVSVENQEFAVIYSSKHKTLVTAMPLEWAHKFRENDLPASDST